MNNENVINNIYEKILYTCIFFYVSYRYLFVHYKYFKDPSFHKNVRFIYMYILSEYILTFDYCCSHNIETQSLNRQRRHSGICISDGRRITLQEGLNSRGHFFIYSINLLKEYVRTLYKDKERKLLEF